MVWFWVLFRFSWVCFCCLAGRLQRREVVCRHTGQRTKMSRAGTSLGSRKLQSTGYAQHLRELTDPVSNKLTKICVCASCFKGAAVQGNQLGAGGPPVVPFDPFLGEGSPTKIDYRKSWYPYSNLSTGGARQAKTLVGGSGGATGRIRYFCPDPNPTMGRLVGCFRQRSLGAI